MGGVILTGYMYNKFKVVENFFNFLWGKPGPINSCKDDKLIN